MTKIDPTTMTMDEYRAAMEREDGRGRLYHHTPYVGVNVHIVDVLDYTVNAEGAPAATVVVEHKPDGKRWSRAKRNVPLAVMFAARNRRPLGSKPVPWN